MAVTIWIHERFSMRPFTGRGRPLRSLVHASRGACLRYNSLE